MKAIGRYDTALQMFVETPHDIDHTVLEFWRWLVTTGKLDDDMSADSE